MKLMVACEHVHVGWGGVLLQSSLLRAHVPATSPELPVKVIFLPLGSMGDLATRGKYHKRFHLVYFSNRLGAGALRHY